MYVKKWSQEHGTCNEKRVPQNLTTSLKTLSPYLVFPMLTPPLTKRLFSSLIYKTTPPFCWEWQRVNHWEVIISSSYSEPEASSSSSPSEEDSSACSGEGEGAKPPRRDKQQVIQPILVFIWHISSNMVKTTTKISMHMLKLLHDVSKGDNYPRWGRRGRWGRGSRGRGYKVCIRRLHTRPLHSKLRHTPPNRLLANGTYDMEERKIRNGDMQVCENAHDSRRKDELITRGSVLISIYNRFYHVWCKVYRKTLHEGKKETSTRLDDSVIVRPWSEYKGHHHIKDPWTLSKLSY